MKTTLVCIGRFHFFDLARELLKRDMLKTIFTGYPSWKLNNEYISKDFIRTFPWLQTPYMALERWEFFGNSRLHRDLAWLSQETLDIYTAKNLPETNILFALSGSGLRCGQLAQRRGAKYICDRGSSHIRYQSIILREEFERWGEAFAGIDPRFIEKEETEYATADLVTVPSTFAYQSFVEMGVPRAKLRIIPYGINTRRFKKVSEPKQDRFEVLFTGQISFQKGVPYLLDAFGRVSHPRKRLRLIGGMSPEMTRYLERFPPSEEVEFLGHITQEKLKNIMSRSHIMVLPSIQEGLALVQAQALACGCPVIGTCHTGAEDLFTDGKEGFIVPIRDSQAIADRLQLLADFPDRRSAMSEAALIRIAHLGGWSDYGERIADVLTNLVNENNYEPIKFPTTII